MFRFIYNVWVTIAYSIWSILLSIITGKMPKISVYHSQNDGVSFEQTPINICSDKFKKVYRKDVVDDYTKQSIIEDFLSHLLNDKKFINPVNEVSFPIFDGKNLIGDQSVSFIIEESLKDYIQKIKAESKNG